MKTIRFTYDERMGYRCSEPGNQDGEYVPLEEAERLATLAQGRLTLEEVREIKKVQADRIASLKGALLNVLTWLTNANAMPTEAMVANVFRALGAAGVPKEDLDSAAICLMRGAAPRTSLGLDDDGVREMLARHGVNYE